MDNNNIISSHKEDFPLFKNNNIVYFDNAATSQRPKQVIQAITQYYEHSNANPLRGFYKLAIDSTQVYQQSREIVRKFINAKYCEEIIFTRGTTESLNLVAYSYGLSNLKKDDEIVVSIMEHHSNLLPWQMVSHITGAKLKFLECEKDGSFLEENITNTITSKTKIVALTYVSNVLGCYNPIKKIADIAHNCGAIVVLDAAQSTPHIVTDVQYLNVDFLAFSGHKIFAPMGIGVLYGKKSLLNSMPPFMSGGEMIDSVSRNKAVYAPLPHKFEAGTVNAAGAYALSEAINYINNIGMSEIVKRECCLTEYLMKGIKQIPHINVIGSQNSNNHCGIVSFTIDGVHPHDISAILDTDNIAVRAGHHCAQPLHTYLNIPSSTRASLMFYNTFEEIDIFLNCLESVRERMGYGK